MKKSEKETVVSSLSGRLQKAKAVVLAEYRGLKVSEITEIRREVRKNAGEFRVVKNRLAKRAVLGAGGGAGGEAGGESNWGALEAHLKGPIAMAISEHDPVVLSKLLTKFAENFAALKLKVAVMEGKLFDSKGIEALSKLPSKEELYAKLLGVLQGPAMGLVRTLNGVPQKLAIALKAIGDKKQ